MGYSYVTVRRNVADRDASFLANFKVNVVEPSSSLSNKFKRLGELGNTISTDGDFLSNHNIASLGSFNNLLISRVNTLSVEMRCNLTDFF